MLLVSNNRLFVWFIAFVPFPKKNWLLFNVIVPIPPRETLQIPEVTLEAFKEFKPLPLTVNVPAVILEAFKFVNEAQEPEKDEADNTFELLSHVKFADCKMDLAAFLTSIWLAVNVVAPVPPLEFDIVPDDTFEAFKEFDEAPEPVKRFAVIYVANIVVPEKTPVKGPPVKGKNNDNVEDIGVPFLYISAQFILFNTSKA